jgi:pyruvate-formate lyase-activating enzyme
MPLDKRNLYRLPWSLNDNAIAWLEITDICNLRCEGCYRQHLTGHKSLEQIKDEILFFKRWRNPDNVSIAGGEPLVHPQILDIVAFIAQNGMKPVVLTNALALTPKLLHELKRAGLAGFTFHVDSHQGRPQWDGKTEKDLNEYRMGLAEMCAHEGGVSAIFNSTVYPSTYHEIPDVVRWGTAHADKVNGLVFITYRTTPGEPSVAYDAAKQEVDLSKLSYARAAIREEFVTSPEVYDSIQSVCPEYEASAYLGGTMLHDSYKWLLGAMVGNKHRLYGSIGKRGMELAQAGHHWFKGSYLAYASSLKMGAKVFLLSPWDKGVRQARNAWLGDMLRHPGRLFAPLYVQSIGIIQAPDLQPDGRADMCDSCPDMTVWDGKLINSCRMDEYRLFGGFVTLLKKEPEQALEPQPEPMPAD